MKLITEVEIKNFRSIKKCNISDIKDFNSLYGLNNSGKSNILRALNLFFNNETDDGKEFDFDTDFHIAPKKTKKRKEIRISVIFVLPKNFKFREKMKKIEKFVLKNKTNRKNRKIKIEKIFRKEYYGPDKINLNNKPVKDTDFRNIDRFLEVINFRYIPNRVLPVEIMKKETNNIKKAITRKLNKLKRDKEKIEEATENLSKAIKETSGKLIKPISEAFKQIYQGNHSIELVTPSSIKDLISTSSYFINTDDTKIKDVYQGSGIQSFLMFHTLNLIDNDYTQQFGWKQATIWAVEEPESSLHSDLEIHLADFLFKTVIEQGSRLQFFCTTHSTMFAIHSQKSILVEKLLNDTTCRSVESKNIYAEAAKSGISPYSHPLLHFLNENIILCEGKTDVVFIEKIFDLLELDRTTFRITCLQDLDNTDKTGGVESIIKYLKENKHLISFKQRKIVLLLDWDTTKNVEQSLSDESLNTVSVIKWPEDIVKKEIKKLKGIESLYPVKFIDEAYESGKFKDALLQNKKDGHYHYTKYSKNHNELKNYLSNEIKNKLLKKEIKHLKDFIENKILIHTNNQV